MNNWGKTSKTPNRWKDELSVPCTPLQMPGLWPVDEPRGAGAVGVSTGQTWGSRKSQPQRTWQEPPSLLSSSQWVCVGGWRESPPGSRS